MESLKKRLESIKDDVLKVTAEEGQHAGMRHANVKDYIAFTKWLKEVTGDENFGLQPSNPGNLRSSYWLAHQAFMSAHQTRLSLLKKVVDTEREIAEVEQDIRRWEWKILEAQRQGAPANEMRLCEVFEGG